MKFGNRIVTDGLVFAVDAANPISYPGSGTTWNDLTLNKNNGTLINGPAFDSANAGSIEFDGNDDNIKFNSSINVGNNFTVCIWNQTTSAERRTLIANSYTYQTSNSSLNGFLFNIGNNGTDLFLSLGKDLQIRISSTGYVTADTWFLACATFDGTDIKLYYNGQETTYALTDGSVGNLVYTNSELYMGGWKLNNASYFSGDFFGGKISNTHIYNRALSASEILQNYNALKGRFGL
tara:strand:- start:23 stop:730 length:708 start_codon:yes stop_codon:yes gene_type:complete